MAKLDLPTGPDELLEAVRKPLAHYLGAEHQMRLGGGTALAARWRHRHSTDIDLFVDPEDFEALFKREQQFRADLERHASGAQNVVIEPAFARIVLMDGGEISISTSPSLTSRSLSNDTVRGTRVPVEATGEILAKKLRYRMIQNAQILPCDLYDIAFARRNAPVALHTALSTLKVEHLHDIDAELGYLRPGWIERHHQPLIEPMRRADAVNAVGIVRGMLQQHVRSSPPVATADSPGSAEPIQCSILPRSDTRICIRRRTIQSGFSLARSSTPATSGGGSRGVCVAGGTPA